MISVSGFDKYLSLYGPKFVSATNRAIESKQLILGPIVEEFEEEFSLYLGSPFACAVNSGTDALKLSIRVLGISGGKLLSVSNAGPYASIAAVESGLVPVFCDVDFHTRLVDADSLFTVLEQNTDTRVVVLTHLFGSPISGIQEIVDELHRRQILVIEDCSQAHGAEVNGLKVGTFGDIAVFSFYPTKNLGAFGDAGMIVTKSETLIEIARSLRQYGWSERYVVRYPQGINSRMDAIQASFLTEVLPELDSWNSNRRTVASVYQEKISHPLVGLPTYSTDSVFHLYTITCEKRNEMMNHLRLNGIESSVHYPTLDHHRFSDLRTYLPNSEELCAKILSIPCNPFMSIDEATLISETINSFK
jgi:aminotransferase EvaB